MRICLATHECRPKPGGIATCYDALARMLADHGHEVILLTTQEDAERPCDRVELVSLAHAMPGAMQTALSVLGSHGMATDFMAIGLAMRHWLETEGIRRGVEVVEACEYGGAGAFLIGGKLPPLLLYCHASRGQVRFHDGHDLDAQERACAFLEMHSILGADEVATYCPANRSIWEQITGRPVMVARAAWDVGAWSDEVTVPRDPNRALVVGRLQRWKGAVETADALALCAEAGSEIVLEWVGGDTSTAPDGGSMAEFIARRYPSLWQTRFVWRSHLDRQGVRAAQMTAGLVAVPSRWDVFNYTALEAMTVGAPIVVSAGAGISYLCEDGVNALIVPAGDAGALASAMMRLSSDRALADRIGGEARSLAMREFASDKVISDRLAAYERAQGHHARRPCVPYADAGASALMDAVASGMASAVADAVNGAPSRELIRGLTRHLGRRLWAGR